MAKTRITQASLLERIAEAIQRSPQGKACAHCVPKSVTAVQAKGDERNWIEADESSVQESGCRALLHEVCKALADEFNVEWSKEAPVAPESAKSVASTVLHQAKRDTSTGFVVEQMEKIFNEGN